MAVTVNGDHYRTMLNDHVDRIISRRADIVWPARSCDLTPLDYYLWFALKDKCYADKPETTDALKDNIRIAIQMPTTDNVLKNWTDRAWPAEEAI